MLLGGGSYMGMERIHRGFQVLSRDRAQHLQEAVPVSICHLGIHREVQDVAHENLDLRAGTIRAACTELARTRCAVKAMVLEDLLTH